MLLHCRRGLEIFGVWSGLPGVRQLGRQEADGFRLVLVGQARALCPIPSQCLRQEWEMLSCRELPAPPCRNAGSSTWPLGPGQRLVVEVEARGWLSHRHLDPGTSSSLVRPCAK